MPRAWAALCSGPAHKTAHNTGLRAVSEAVEVDVADSSVSCHTMSKRPPTLDTAAPRASGWGRAGTARFSAEIPFFPGVDRPIPPTPASSVN